MADKYPGCEYEVIQTRRGPQETGRIKLYSPDGSIFMMPPGGNPMIYTDTRRGYKTSPDDIWKSKNAEWSEIQETSLKISNFQRDAKNRQKAIENKQILDAQLAQMERMEADMKAAEDALNAPKNPAPEVEADAEPEAPKPKPKAKAKVVK